MDAPGLCYFCPDFCHTEDNRPLVHVGEQSVKEQPCQHQGILTPSTAQSPGPPGTFFITLLKQVPSVGSL